jgi:hypothetical protein
MAASDRTDAAEAALAVSRLEGALRDAGLRPERVSAAVKVADVSVLKVEGTEVFGLTETVESLKTLSPEWFDVPRHSAPDATPQDRRRDFRTASRRELSEELAEYGIRHY